jgi:hypothetical protein
MASKEHLAQLQQGVKTWNDWRSLNPNITPDLVEAHLTGANLAGVNLRGPAIGWTIWGDVDLSAPRGLETVWHRGPSTIGIDTLYSSKGNIREAFPRGAGVPDNFITYIKSLVGRPFEFYTSWLSNGSDWPFNA